MAVRSGEGEMRLTRDKARTLRAILLAGILLSCGISTAQTSSPWARGPVLGISGDGLVVLSWKTSRPVSIDLHYGLAQVHRGSETWDETLTFDRQQGSAEIWLNDLQPGAEYRYQLIAYEGDAVYPSRVNSFRTPDPDARSFAFGVYGHTRSFPDRHKLVADTIARDEAIAAFVAHVGRLVESFSTDRVDNFFWSIADLARSLPYVAVTEGGQTEEPIYYDTFALPRGGGTAGEQWWSFDYGPVHLVGLDSSLTDPDAARSQEQLAWLRRDLSASEAGLTVIFSSDALYGSAYPSGRNDALIALWEPILCANSVSVVFSASSGAYEHIYANGIHHVTTGGGGGPLSDRPDHSPPGLIFSRYGMLHYVRVTIADEALRAEAVPIASVIQDEVYLTPSSRAIDSFVVRSEEE